MESDWPVSDQRGYGISRSTWMEESEEAVSSLELEVSCVVNHDNT